MAKAPAITGIDHLYLTVSDLARSERYYDAVMVAALGWRKQRFELGGEPHVQYYNRHFGVVLRPMRGSARHDPYAPGLHHFCMRVETPADVHALVDRLQALGIAASAARAYPDYAPDYVATFLVDPDGIRLEVTNYRQERRERHDHWDATAAP